MKLSKKALRSKNMKAIRSNGSEIERILMKALWGRKLRFSKNDKSVFGKPDIVFKKLKIAVFVDSEFWHGKDWKYRKKDHKTNKEFWIKKIERNIQRDKEVNKTLKKAGWKILRFWGSKIKYDIDNCIKKVVLNINESKN